MAKPAAVLLVVQTLPLRLLLAALTVTAGVLVTLCLTPPNTASSRTANSVDTAIFPYSLELLAIARLGLAQLAVAQAIVVLVKPDIINTFRLNQTLFTANWISVPLLIIVAAAAWLRLQAYTTLGTNFTFDLRQPSGLVTTGMYAYIQHPSYTTAFVAVVGMVCWIVRLDGVLGIVTPEVLRKRQHALHWLLAVAVTLIHLVVFAVRVPEEEAMLRRAFGGEWQRWHESTARFIPGVF